jgi:two-component system response regulator
MNDHAIILLVEDSASDEELTLRALKRANVRNPIVVARDGAAALDYLFARGAHADRPLDTEIQVVLLDLNLPKLSGLDVLRAIRGSEQTRRLPVVILTSSHEDRDVIESYDRGANSYIVKPVDFVQFAEAVRQLGLYWLVLNQRPPRSTP